MKMKCHVFHDNNKYYKERQRRQKTKKCSNPKNPKIKKKDIVKIDNFKLADFSFH